MKPEMSPYFYPTNIILIDDNEAFLTTLALSLSQSFTCQSFINPTDALLHVNNIHHLQQTAPSLFPKRKPSLQATFGEVPRKTLGTVEHMELSVIVVDYDMPEVNGIEFCAQVNDPSIRKILLTGCASSNVVFNAFNDNIIDYYIDKQTDGLLGKVQSVVAKMQKEYFFEQLKTLTMDYIKQEAPCFLDSALADFFDDICMELDVNEYHFSAEKSHFILHSNEKTYSMITLDDAKMEEHIQIIKDEDGPNEWVEKLKTKMYVAYFDSEDGFYTPETQTNEHPLVKATIINGKQNYYCAVVENFTVDPTGENDKKLH
jgi:response regulator RpfG family c-di-GMP phosphodiesterase